MIIHITKSKLFTLDPAIRFSNRYRVKKKVFHELYRRYGLEQYDMDGLCGYFQYKTGRKPDKDVIKLWLMKTEIYGKAQHALRMGVRVVDSQFFGEYEEFVIKETTRHLRNGEAQNNRTLV